jgi:hypothetical protein
MFPLDGRTIQRLAKQICDVGGPFQRSGRELERLLVDAGWADPPEYDGSARVGWLEEALTERRDHHVEMERLLCRLCDPLEYDEGAGAAEEFRGYLNEVLAPERLVVSVVGGRPVLGEIGSSGSAGSAFAEPEDLENRLRGLIEDAKAVDLLMGRVAETRVCEENGAFGLAVVGIGSFVESLLYSVLIERDAELKANGFRDGRGKPASPSLMRLIDTAHDKGWIEVDAKDFTHKVRDYRNVVHLRHQMELDMTPDRDTVMLCWGPVRAVLNDLEKNLT